MREIGFEIASPCATRGSVQRGAAARLPSRRAPPPAMPAAAVRDDGMVVVSFRHTGSAPVLRQQKFKVRADQRFAVVGDLLRQQLGLAPAESLFLYCNSAFAPPPDELVRDVAQCFAVEGVLVLNYCTTPAWG